MTFNCRMLKYLHARGLILWTLTSGGVYANEAGWRSLDRGVTPRHHVVQVLNYNVIQTMVSKINY